MEDNVLAGELEGGAGGLEKALRPKGFDDYIGQREIKENLGVLSLIHISEPTRPY